MKVNISIEKPLYGFTQFIPKSINKPTQCYSSPFHYGYILEQNCFNLDEQIGVYLIKAYGECDILNDKQFECTDYDIEHIYTFKELSALLNDGLENYGMGNTGYFNKGSYNEGDYNIGNYNQGFYNKGSHNEGYFNVGRHLRGWFNDSNCPSSSSGLFIFNIPTTEIPEENANKMIEIIENFTKAYPCNIAYLRHSHLKKALQAFPEFNEEIFDTNFTQITKKFK